MILVHLYDNSLGVFVFAVYWPAVPRVGDAVRHSAVDCHVRRVEWDSRSSIVLIYLTPLSENLVGKQWWAE